MWLYSYTDFLGTEPDYVTMNISLVGHTLLIGGVAREYYAMHSSLLPL